MAMPSRTTRAGVLVLLLVVLLPMRILAQTTDFPTVFPLPVLVLSQDQLFSESLLGQAILDLESQETDDLVEEGKRIEELFKAEESELTRRRPAMEANAFRALADDFDARVEASRSAQLQAATETQQRAEARRRKFIEVAGPVLGRLLAKYQATALLDVRTVLLFNRNMDVTREAIEMLDEAYRADPNMLTSVKEE